MKDEPHPINRTQDLRGFLVFKDIFDIKCFHNFKFLNSKRVLNENVIGVVKRFKILAEKYRNRRKRFNLRFNLIAGIYNFELKI